MPAGVQFTLGDDNFTVVQSVGFNNFAPELVQVVGNTEDRQTLVLNLRADSNSHNQSMYVGGPPQSGILFTVPKIGLPPSFYLPERYVLTFRQYGPIMQGEVWYKTDYTLFDDALVTEVIATCGCPCEIDCNMAAKKMYDSRAAQVTAQQVASGRVKLLGANANRLTLVLSCGDTAAGSLLNVAADQGGTKLILRTSNPQTVTFPYRDFGPLITGEIWVAIESSTPTAVVNGTEVFVVPE